MKSMMGGTYWENVGRAAPSMESEECGPGCAAL
jgi:hypothetical protein